MRDFAVPGGILTTKLLNRCSGSGKPFMRARCTAIQSSSIACTWSQIASMCQFHTSGVVGSRTCHPSRKNVAREARAAMASFRSSAVREARCSFAASFFLSSSLTLAKRNEGVSIRGSRIGVDRIMALACRRIRRGKRLDQPDALIRHHAVEHRKLLGREPLEVLGIARDFGLNRERVKAGMEVPDDFALRDPPILFIANFRELTFALGPVPDAAHRGLAQVVRLGGFRDALPGEECPQDCPLVFSIRRFPPRHTVTLS